MDILNRVYHLNREIEFSDISERDIKDFKFNRVTPRLIRREAREIDESFTSRKGNFIEKKTIIPPFYYFRNYDYSRSFSERTKSLWELGLLIPNINQIEILPETVISYKKVEYCSSNFNGISPLESLEYFIELNTDKDKLNMIKDAIKKGVFLNYLGDFHTENIKNEDFESAFCHMIIRDDYINSILDNDRNSILHKATYDKIKPYISEDELIGFFNKK